MEKKTLKRIFEFLEEKENHNVPFLWKHKNNIPLTKEDLIVKGNLNLKGSKITSLPEGLEVGGSLSLIGLAITSLSKSLKVDGSIYLKDSKITSLPKGLKVGRNLVLSRSSLLKFEHTDDELREMIQPGFIEGEIYRG